MRFAFKFYLYLSFVFSSYFANATTAEDCTNASPSHLAYCYTISGAAGRFVQWPSVINSDGSVTTNFTDVCYYPATSTAPEYRFIAWECYATTSASSGQAISGPPELPPICGAGSVIRFEEGSLGEELDVAGTPFRLVYTSDRTVGNVKARTIPLVTGHDDLSLSGYDFTVIYNGKSVSYSLGLNQSANFVWDGKDASGNYVETPIPVTVGVRDVHLDGSPCSGYVENTYHPGTWNMQRIGLGGWNFDVHHRYLNGLLYLGNGKTEKVDAIQSSTNIRIIAKDGSEIYYFDLNGRHLTTNNVLTNAVIYTFNYLPNGYLSSIVDAYGNTTTVIRDSSNNPIGIQSPYKHLTVLQTGTDGYLSSIQNPNGATYSMTYYSGGLLHTFQKPKGQVSTMTYDSKGNLTLDSSSSGAYTSLLTTQTDLFSKSISIADAVGPKSTISLTQLNGASRTYTKRSGETHYSSFSPTTGSYEQTNVPASNLYVTYQNDLRFQSFLKTPRFITREITGQDTLTASYWNAIVPGTGPFDYQSLRTQLVVNDKFTEYIYTLATGVESIRSPMNRMSYITTDTNGKVTSHQIASFLPMLSSYDTRGRLSTLSQGVRQTDMTYSSSGDISSVKNPLNQVTNFIYDSVGNVSSIVLPDTRTINYTYDSNGNVASVTPASSLSHAFTFNAFDLPASYAAPSVPISTPATYYSYDNAARITQVTKPDLSTVNYSYHATTGLLTSITAGSDTTTFSMTANNNIASVTSHDNIVTTQTFVDKRLLTSSGVAPGSVSTGGVAYVYNAYYNPATLTLSDGGSSPFTVSYVYDYDTYLTGVGDLQYTLDGATGIKTKATLNNIEENYSFDTSFGEPSSFSANYAPSSSSPAQIFSQTYTRDNLGRITTKSETVGSTTDVFGYSYDSTGRLSTVTKNSASFSNYIYDSNNNLTSGTVGGVTFSATYDAQDRVLTYNSNTYSHNNNGELINKTVGSTSTAFTYDGFGMLKTVVVGTSPTITYLYDGLNRRIGRASGSTVQKYWLYQDQLRIAAELNSSGLITKKFIYGTKDNVPEYMIAGGNTYKIIADNIGSVRFVVHASTGVTYQALEYNERGEVLSDSNPGFQPFGFAGGLYDADTKLVHFGARDYDPSIGRWLSKDPIGFKGGDTNLYGYVLNDPINLIDPMGLWGFQVGAGGSLGFLFGGGGADSGFAFTYSDQHGFQAGTYGTKTGKVGTGAAGGLGVNATVTPNAQCLNDLSGGSFVGGFDSAISGSVGHSTTSDGRSMTSFGLGLGLGTGLFPYGGVSNTWVIPFGN